MYEGNFEHAHKQNTCEFPPPRSTTNIIVSLSGYYATLLLYYMFTRLWVIIRLKNVHLSNEALWFGNYN